MTEKKHRSLKDLFKHLSLLLLLLLNKLGNLDHRLFLRRRNLKLLLTPQTSSSLKPSLGISPAASDLEESVRKGKGHRRKHELSHLSLKRFFKILRPEHLDDGVKEKTPPELPLSLTLDLAKKYDIGKLIGTGASGSVNLVTAHGNENEIFAVKKFRARLKNELEHDYQTKVKNEFLIGDYLKHQNLVHTMELIKEKLEYLIVMEYCPYDFFNLVMLGLMKVEEVCCYFKQIVNGVAHLHEAGIAHRDLKLDNCVVNLDGVLKLIDFGSAFQYRKDSKSSSGPQTKILKAKGIVGSDPYLAPEVFDTTTPYDARLADVWSIAIIFCCMILKRFPWKLPRSSDPLFRSFACLNSMDEPVSEQEMEEKDSKGPKYGPERLLRLLPQGSRPLIASMLTIDTTKRCLIGDVLADPFYKDIQNCYYAEVDEKPQEEFKEAKEDNLLPPQPPMSPEAALSPGSELQTPSSSGSGTPRVLSHDAISHDNSAHRFGSHIHNPEAFAGTTAVKRVERFFKAPNHTHHLVTEKELEQINAERQRARKLKESGTA